MRAQSSLRMKTVLEGKKYRMIKERDPYLRKFLSYIWLVVRRIFRRTPSCSPPVLLLLPRHALLATANTGSWGTETCGLIQGSRSSLSGTDLSSAYLS